MSDPKTHLACDSSWTRMVHQCWRSEVGGSLICMVWFELGARCITTRFWPRGSFITCEDNGTDIEPCINDVYMGWLL